jgi:hypothetical protein
LVGGATKAEAATKEEEEGTTTMMVPVEEMEVLLVVQGLVGWLDEIGCGHLGSVH